LIGGEPPLSRRTAWPARFPVFYGWVIAAVVFGLTFIATAPFWTIGVFVQPMQEDLGWSRSSILGALTVRNLASALAGPLLGGFLDRPGGARWAGVLSGVLVAGSLLLTYRVETEIELFLVFGVLGGLGSVVQSNALFGATIPKWFVRRRGIVVALVTMGSPLATLLLPSVFAAVIADHGWRSAWLVMGGLSVVLGVLPAFLLVSRPEDVGLRPDGTQAAPASAASRTTDEVSFSLTQAVRTPVFWLLNLSIALGSFPVSGLPANLVSLFTDRGISRDLAVLGFSTYGLLGLLGRIFWGILINRRGVVLVMVLLGVYGAAITPLILIAQGDTAVAYAPLIAFGIGSYVSFNQLVWASYFGRDHLGAITGLARPFSSVTSALGPLALAWLYDGSGGYDAGILLVAATWALSAATLGLVQWGLPKRQATTLNARGDSDGR